MERLEDLGGEWGAVRDAGGDTVLCTRIARDWQNPSKWVVLGQGDVSTREAQAGGQTGLSQSFSPAPSALLLTGIRTQVMS